MFQCRGNIYGFKLYFNVGGIFMALNNVNIYGFKLCEYLWLQITLGITLR